MEELVDRIKKLMKEEHITQKEIATLSGIPYQKIRYFFSGRCKNPDKKIFYAIGVAFGKKSALEK